MNRQRAVGPPAQSLDDSFHIRVREYFAPAIVTTVMLVLSFFLHYKYCDTPISFPESEWDEIVSVHQRSYPFSMRYLTTYSVLAMHEGFGIPLREAFFALQFTLAFLVGLVFYRYLRISLFSARWATLGVFLVLSAYPVLCAHFEPVHTWDDLWMYLFLMLSFGSLMQGRCATGTVMFTLACFAREQSLTFYPVLILAIWFFCSQLSARRRIVWLAFPLVIYGAFYALVWEDPDPQRFRLFQFNFESFIRSRDTLYSLFISFGFIWVAATVGLVRIGWGWMKSASPLEKFFFWCVVLTVPLTVVFTLSLTRARETRIFFPPFIFLIPLALMEIQRVTARLRTLTRPSLYWLLGVFALLMAIGFKLGYQLFPSFEYRNCQYFARQCAGVHIGVIFCLLAVWATSKWHKRIVT